MIERAAFHALGTRVPTQRAILTAVSRWAPENSLSVATRRNILTACQQRLVSAPKSTNAPS